jgi:hypothetical protein
MELEGRQAINGVGKERIADFLQYLHSDTERDAFCNVRKTSTN